MISTIAISVHNNKASVRARQCATTDMPKLPASIDASLVNDLKTVVLKDVLSGRFGAQLHVLPTYSMRYRLNIKADILRAAVTGDNTETTDYNQLSLDEALEYAQVWLSFDVAAEALKTAERRFASASKQSTPRRRYVEVSYAKKTPQDLNVPADIEAIWRHHLADCILDDVIVDGVTGTRRRTISPDFEIIYSLQLRQDVMEDMTESFRVDWAGSLVTKAFERVLTLARVWISFTETLEISEPELAMPPSPALSECTLVGDESDNEDAVKPLKSALSAGSKYITGRRIQFNPVDQVKVFESVAPYDEDEDEDDMATTTVLPESEWTSAKELDLASSEEFPSLMAAPVKASTASKKKAPVPVKVKISTSSSRIGYASKVKAVNVAKPVRASQPLAQEPPENQLKAWTTSSKLVFVKIQR